MFLMIAVSMMYAWSDHPDQCQIDQKDVQRVDKTFDQPLLKLHSDEAASNARRFPDNEKNGSLDNEDEPEPNGLIDHHAARFDRNLIRLCGDEGNNPPPRPSDDEKNIDVHDPDPMGLMELHRREMEKNKWWGVPDRD
jgi:hypothetical protein